MSTTCPLVLQCEQGDANSAAFPRELQCGYRSKVCSSVRATKLDGTLHKLCEFHRLKANSSQRRLQKRRQMRKLEEAVTGKHAHDSDSGYSATSASASPIRQTKRSRVAQGLVSGTADEIMALVGDSEPYKFAANDVTTFEQAHFSPAPSSIGGMDISMPMPLGNLEMDAVVADVLRECSGTVGFPMVDAPSSWNMV